MRKLMWFAMGFAAACALGVWVLDVRFLMPSVLLLMAVAAAAGKWGLRRACTVCLGCAVGLGWYLGFQKYYLIPAHAMDGSTIETTVTATGYSYETDYGVGVDGEYLLNGKTYKIRLYVNESEQIRPGDTITGSFRLRYTAPGGMRDATYHAGDKILFLGYQRGSAEIRMAAEERLADRFLGLNYLIGGRLNAIFPERWAPLARALLLGDDYDLDYETDIALKISGIRHIIAVSGLHVAILYTMLRALTLNRRMLTAVIGFPVLYVFALAAGFTPSVTRACIMVALMMLSQLINQEYDSATALAFAAQVMLLENPLVITSISFQMSFACVAGILLFNERIFAWLKAKLNAPEGKILKAKIFRWFISSVSISLSAMCLTTPMSAYYFGTVSLVSVLTNLLTLWAVSLAFYGIVAALLASLVWLQGAAVIARCASLFLAYVAAVADLLSSFPLAAVYTKSVYIVVWLVFVYALLAVFMLSRNRSARVLTCCAVLGLCLALTISWTEHTFSGVHLTALDVGQGQSLILHAEGKTYLIDCGGSNDEIAANTAAETLLSRGVTYLDGIILTHGDRDHAGGVPYLLKRIDTDFIMLPSTSAETEIQMLAECTSGRVIPVSENLILPSDTSKITVFGPTFGTESNENSLCILFESENCDILVTGDRSRMGELLLLRQTQLPELELLIAGHHGSQNSTSEELLNAVSPEVVFISVGENNAYGHPAEELLRRLAAFDCEIFRTDLNGNLTFRR